MLKESRCEVVRQNGVFFKTFRNHQRIYQNAKLLKANLQYVQDVTQQPSSWALLYIFLPPITNIFFLIYAKVSFETDLEFQRYSPLVGRFRPMLHYIYQQTARIQRYLIFTIQTYILLITKYGVKWKLLAGKLLLLVFFNKFIRNGACDVTARRRRLRTL